MNNNKKIVMGVTPAIFAVLFAVSFVPADTFGGSTYSDDAQFGGVFTFTHRDADGNVIQTFQQHNLVVNEGMECVSDFVFGTTSCTGEAVFQYLAVGTGATAVADAQTALITESGTCARVQDATPAIDTGTTGQRTITISSVFSGANCEGASFAETGLFDAATTGNMLARALISPTINLGSGDTLQIDYDIVINNT